MAKRLGLLRDLVPAAARIAVLVNPANVGRGMLTRTDLEFFALRGGGLHDAGWDGSQRPESELAVLPRRTHYDVFAAPELAGVVTGFLDRP